MKLMFAIPNGAAVRRQTDKHGNTFSLEGMKLKEEGLKSGVPDIFLPVARDQWHGLFIEMKTRFGRVRPEQTQWGYDLSEQYYRVGICRSWLEARELIKEYLGVNDDGTTKI